MKQLKFSFRSAKKPQMQRAFVVAIAMAITALLVHTAAIQPTVFELSNSNVDMAVDAQGNLVRLINRQTGHNYLTSSTGHELWKMYYRTSDARELEIRAPIQKAQVSREGNALVIAYPSLTGNVALAGSSRALKIAFTLRAELEGDRITWTATIKNSETEAGLEISELWIPWIYGVGNLGKGHEADELYWPEDGGRRITDPYTKLINNQSNAAASPVGDGVANRYRVTYPWPASMQWYAFSNGEEGIYVGSHDKSIMTTTLNVMVDRNGLSSSIVKYPFVKTGETWTSPPTIIRLFTGDWHEGARTYRTWADAWMTKPNPPKWMRRANGWIIPNLKAQNGSRYSGVYADLPRYFRDAHAVGIDMVSIYGWEKQGFDNWYPEYDPDPGMGGEAGLKAAIAEIKKGGGKANLYSQGQLIDPGTEYYRRIGYKQTAKDIWGGEYRETYGGSGSGTLLTIMKNKSFGVACPLAPGWYEQLVSQFGMAQKYGVTGLMYDQIGGRPPYICYDKSHLHSKPSLAFGPGKLKNLIKLRDLIKARDPEFAFVHELVVDAFSGIADITHSYSYGFDTRAESFGEMFKYTFPDRIITNRTTGNRRACFGHGFALQWRVDGMMRDTTDPIMAAYLKRLNQLRTQFADLLLDGRFVDNEGFTSNNKSVASYAYLAGNRMAITLWNSTGVSQKPDITAKGYTLESANWQDPAWQGMDHQILPGDVAVLVFKK